MEGERAHIDLLKNINSNTDSLQRKGFLLNDGLGEPRDDKDAPLQEEEKSCKPVASTGHSYGLTESIQIGKDGQIAHYNYDGGPGNKASAVQDSGATVSACKQQDPMEEEFLKAARMEVERQLKTVMKQTGKNVNIDVLGCSVDNDKITLSDSEEEDPIKAAQMQLKKQLEAGKKARGCPRKKSSGKNVNKDAAGSVYNGTISTLSSSQKEEVIKAAKIEVKNELAKIQENYSEDSQLKRACVKVIDIEANVKPSNLYDNTDSVSTVSADEEDDPINEDLIKAAQKDINEVLESGDKSKDGRPKRASAKKALNNIAVINRLVENNPNIDGTRPGRTRVITTNAETWYATTNTEYAPAGGKEEFGDSDEEEEEEDEDDVLGEREQISSRSRPQTKGDIKDEVKIPPLKREPQGIQLIRQRINLRAPTSHDIKLSELFRCKICHLSVTSFKALFSHIYIVHKLLKYFECQECGKKVETAEEYEKHLQLHSLRHTEVFYTVSQYQKGDNILYQCPLAACSSRPLSWSMFINHMHFHRPSDCLLCGERVAQNQMKTFFSHMSLHIADGPFLCPYCPTMGFRDTHTLKQHLGKKHGALNGSWMCRFCFTGKHFNKFALLDLHLLKNHTNTPYTCQYCGQEFTSIVILDSHMKTHTVRGADHDKIYNRKTLYQGDTNAGDKVSKQRKSGPLILRQNRFKKDSINGTLRSMLTESSPSHSTSSTASKLPTALSSITANSLIGQEVQKLISASPSKKVLYLIKSADGTTKVVQNDPRVGITQSTSLPVASTQLSAASSMQHMVYQVAPKTLSLTPETRPTVSATQYLIPYDASTSSMLTPTAPSVMLNSGASPGGTNIPGQQRVFVLLQQPPNTQQGGTGSGPVMSSTSANSSSLGMGLKISNVRSTSKEPLKIEPRLKNEILIEPGLESGFNFDRGMMNEMSKYTQEVDNTDLHCNSDFGGIIGDDDNGDSQASTEMSPIVIAPIQDSTDKEGQPGGSGSHKPDLMVCPYPHCLTVSSSATDLWTNHYFPKHMQSTEAKEFMCTKCFGLYTNDSWPPANHSCTDIQWIHICADCGLLFENLRQKQQHFIQCKAHVPEESVVLAGSIVDPLTCRYCQETKTSTHNLGNHVKTFHPSVRFYSSQILCELCPTIRRFMSTKHLWSHNEVMHDEWWVNSGVWLCRTCGADNTTEQEYNEHVAYSHGRYIGPILKCSICNKTWTSRWLLDRHIATVHERNTSSPETTDEIDPIGLMEGLYGSHKSNATIIIPSEWIDASESEGETEEEEIQTSVQVEFNSEIPRTITVEEIEKGADLREFLRESHVPNPQSSIVIQEKVEEYTKVTKDTLSQNSSKPQDDSSATNGALSLSKGEGTHDSNENPGPETILFMCERCDDIFYGFSELKDHVRLKHEPIKKLPSCPCPDELPLVTRKWVHKYWHHVISYHNDWLSSYEFACTVCGHLFKEMSSFDMHQIYHHKNDVKCIKISQCRMIVQKTTPKGHEASSTVVPFPPNEKHKSGSDLKNAINLVSSDEEDVENSEKPKSSDLCKQETPPAMDKDIEVTSDRSGNVADHMCTQCGKSLPNMLALQKHLKTVHPVGMIKCENCKARMSLEAIQNHICTTDEPLMAFFGCNFCHQKFDSIVAKNKHIAINHKRELKRCPRCGKAFVTEDTLDKHIEKMHPDYSPAPRPPTPQRTQQPSIKRKNKRLPPTASVPTPTPSQAVPIVHIPKITPVNPQVPLIPNTTTQAVRRNASKAPNTLLQKTKSKWTWPNPEKKSVVASRKTIFSPPVQCETCLLYFRDDLQLRVHCEKRNHGSVLKKNIWGSSKIDEPDAGRSTMRGDIDDSQQTKSLGTRVITIGGADDDTDSLLQMEETDYASENSDDGEEEEDEDAPQKTKSFATRVISLSEVEDEKEEDEGGEEEAAAVGEEADETEDDQGRILALQRAGDSSDEDDDYSAVTQLEPILDEHPANRGIGANSNTNKRSAADDVFDADAEPNAQILDEVFGPKRSRTEELAEKRAREEAVFGPQKASQALIDEVFGPQNQCETSHNSETNNDAFPTLDNTLLQEGHSNGERQAGYEEPFSNPFQNISRCLEIAPIIEPNEGTDLMTSNLINPFSSCMDSMAPVPITIAPEPYEDDATLPLGQQCLTETCDSMTSSCSNVLLSANSDMYQAHDVAQEYKCEQCGMTFDLDCHLQIHKLNTQHF